MVHPEVESDIREQARGFLVRALSDSKDDQNMTGAAEGGYISFDDIYFRGVFAAAALQLSDDVVDSQQLGNPEITKRFYDRKKRAPNLVSEIYGCTVEEVIERDRKMDQGIERYVDSKSQKRSD